MSDIKDKTTVTETEKPQETTTGNTAGSIAIGVAALLAGAVSAIAEKVSEKTTGEVSEPSAEELDRKEKLDEKAAELRQQRLADPNATGAVDDIKEKVEQVTRRGTA